MEYITTTTALEDLCQHLASHKFVTVDLEFLREHSYYAKLCLIQLGSEERCAVVDPLAEDIDLAPFFALMQNSKVVKVFHSGRQDIEIIYNLSGKIPTPLFDTQVAAMVTGFGESVSYENLVLHLLGCRLDKTSRLSDWSKRPLTESQLSYALSDVTHLVNLYTQLQQKLDLLGRNDWIKEEMAVLENPNTYEIRPEDAWLKIKHRSHNAFFLTKLKELAAWRERRSQLKNTPRHSFIKDDMLLAVCTTDPQNKEQLCQIRTFRKDIAMGKLGDEILEVLERCRHIPEAEYVTPPKLKDLPDKNSALFELLKLLLKIVSQQEGVVARLIANDENLHAFSCFQDQNNPILSGWRKDIFGSKALEMRGGNIAIAYNPQSRSIEFRTHD